MNPGTTWPAEWCEHDATWLSWPYNTDTWPVNLVAAQTEFAAFVRAVADAEPVRLLCGGAAMDSAQRHVGDVHNVELLNIRTNDAWIRDYGPTFVNRDGQLTAIDWRYDAWGGKYPPYDDDARNAAHIAQIVAAERIDVDLVIEGGALETNGTGVLLTTESCLLNENRNGPQLRDRIESELRSQLGVKQICWLSGGDIAGDDTDGHIDQIARFVNQTTIVVSTTDDPNDANFPALSGARDELREVVQAEFNEQTKLTVVDLPTPQPVMLNGVRLPAGYANFYFANGIVIVPQFDDPADSAAISILKSLLPERDVIGLPSRNLSAGLGSFHCLSQQQPKIRPTEV